MGLLDRLFGGTEKPQATPVPQPAAGPPQSADERALAQYRYMLQTAPPQTIEQAHTEAFAKLSPQQRSLLLTQLAAELPQAERSAPGTATQDDPQSLARLATRAEVRQPGTLERTFSGMGGRGLGMGGMMAGGLLSGIAGAVIGSAIAQSFLGDSASADASDAHDASADTASDTSAEASSDSDVGDFEGDDFDFG